MRTDAERRRRVLERSDGRCHLCGKRAAARNYGKVGARGAWEIDHDVPRSKGGTDHLNNLRAAHCSCNRAKGARSSRAARAKYGRTAAPMSAAQAEDARCKAGLASAALAVVLIGGAGPAIAGIVGVIAYCFGHDANPHE